jgi:hypothetical protein
MQPARQPESGRCKESDEVTSPQDAGNSPAGTHLVLADAGAADYRVAGINARLKPELPPQQRGKLIEFCRRVKKSA